MAQYAEKDGMKRTKTNRITFSVIQPYKPLLHLCGSGFCKCDDQNVLRLYMMLFYQIFDSLRYGERFARTGSCKDKHCPILVCNCPALCLIDTAVQLIKHFQAVQYPY